MIGDNFYCYSPKLKAELNNLGFKYKWCDTHNITKKVFWVYIVTPELKKYLDNRKGA